MKGRKRAVPSRSSLMRKPSIELSLGFEVDVWDLMQKSIITAVTPPIGRLIQKHQHHVVRSVKTPVGDPVSLPSTSKFEANWIKTNLRV